MINEDESLDPVVEIPAEEFTVDTPPVAPVELPEQKYEYQPTDEAGRALGGRQVIKYRTEQELRDKLTEQSILLIRKLREQTRKSRLGIAEDEEIPETAPRFQMPVEFTPETIAKDPAALCKTLQDLQTNNMRLLAKVEADVFVQNNPEYYKCKENFDVVTNWMLRKDLAPVRENFQLAYETLDAAGLLLKAPIVREEPIVALPVEAAIPVPPTPGEATGVTPANAPVEAEPSRITSEQPSHSKRVVSRVATGLTREMAGVSGTSPKSGYTLREINAMPSDIYKKKLINEKGFAETVERLEREASEKR